MPNTASVVAICVGIFSLTMRYTGWFQIKEAWFVTVAAGLVEVWAVLSMLFCDTSVTEMALIVFSTLVALISHGYRAASGTGSGSIARRRIMVNTVMCSYFLGMQLQNKLGETCDMVSIVLPSFIIVFLFADMYMLHEVYGGRDVFDPRDLI